MNCQSHQKNISKLLDGELGPAAAAELLRHLAACGDCRRVHERMTFMDRDLKALALAEAPPELANRVKARISSLGDQPSHGIFSPVWKQVSILAMTVLLAIGAGNLAGRSVSNLFLHDRAESMLEMVAPDAGESLADLLMDVGTEENSR
jgi:anti-sigma factor RsiW